MVLKAITPLVGGLVPPPPCLLRALLGSRQPSWRHTFVSLWTGAAPSWRHRARPIGEIKKEGSGRAPYVWNHHVRGNVRFVPGAEPDDGFLPNRMICAAYAWAARTGSVQGGRA
jgi:hypothetical protein